MRQLKYDIYSEKIILEDLKYWLDEDDIPKHIKDFFYEECDKFVLKDNKTNDLYCPKCGHKLEKDFCKDCQKNYLIKNTNFNEVNIKELKKYKFNNYYFVFDVVDKEVIIYLINIFITYDNPLTNNPFRSIYLRVENAYHVLKDCLINLKQKDKIYFFKELDSNILYEEYFFNYDLDFYLDCYDIAKVYTDNLDILKDTIYRYTNIWEAKDYLKNKNIYLSNLTYIPLYYASFEYLIKKKFYSLAFDNPHLIKKDNDTKLLIKNDLDFMIENNFDYWKFRTLKLCKIKDMEMINYMEDTIEAYENVLNIKKMDILKLYNYLKTNQNDIVEYFDYLRLANELGYDLKDKKVLYPLDLFNAHNEVFEKKNTIVNKKCNKKIKELAKTLIKNKYEDDKYIIKPAGSVKEMLNEGKQQNNCLSTYILDFSKNKTQIYFMRKKSDLKKSFVTIEVKNRKLIQARLKNNEKPDDEILTIINKWLKTIK